MPTFSPGLRSTPCPCVPTQTTVGLTGPPARQRTSWPAWGNATVQSHAGVGPARTRPVEDSALSPDFQQVLQVGEIGFELPLEHSDGQRLG